jgi:acyl-CoA synthetase (AMP-forming)/AMP-acid ligase II
MSADASLLTAPGAAFELVETGIRGYRCRTFRHAPPTLPEFFDSLDWRADRECLVYGGQRLSFADVWTRSAALAVALRQHHGVEPGAHVGLAMRNLPEWMIAFLAIARLGAVPVLCNSRGSSAELAHARDSSGCVAVIADGRCGRELARAGASPVPWLVVADSAALGAGGERDVDDLRAARTAGAGDFAEFLQRGAGCRPPAVQVAPLDPAMILFTSGTTGRARGAILSHIGTTNAIYANLFSGALVGRRFAARLGIPFEQLAARLPQACQLLVFPLFHTSGVHSGFLATLARGGKIVLMRRWDAGDALALIARERVTQFPAVPTMLWDLVHEPLEGAPDCSTLANVSTGGQGLPAGLLAELVRRFPNAVPGTGFGLTESTGAVALAVGEDFLAHPTAAGRLLPTTEVRILGPDDRPAAAGVPGEICLRGITNMLGYLGDPEETRRTIDAEGFMRTGDIGFVDTDGFIHIVDRKKDMVISGGENIWCAEIERALLANPDVQEAAAFGVPDARLGERLVVAVVPRPGAAARLVPADLQAQLGEVLAAYKVPREILVRATALPRNLLDKVDKRLLRQQSTA